MEENEGTKIFLNNPVICNPNPGLLYLCCPFINLKPEGELSGQLAYFVLYWIHRNIRLFHIRGFFHSKVHCPNGSLACVYAR